MHSSDSPTRAIPEGHIPLTTDWPCVFDYIGRLRQVSVQLQHRHAQMSMHLSQDEWLASMQGRYSENGLTVCSDYTGWGHATACATVCDCYLVPGEVFFYNQVQEQFLLVNPTACTDSYRWGRLLNEISVEPEWLELNRAKRSFYQPEGLGYFSGVDLGVSGIEVVELLRHFAEAELQLEFTMCRREAVARQTCRIVDLQNSDRLLEYRGPNAVFSMYTPAIKRAIASYEEGRMTVALIDCGGEVLFKVRAAFNVGEEDRFHKILHSHPTGCA